MSRSEDPTDHDPVTQDRAEPEQLPDHTAGRREQTRDDTDEGWGDWRDREDRDAWLREQRPPHWD